jgi:hypothetical protein
VEIYDNYREIFWMNIQLTITAEHDLDVRHLERNRLRIEEAIKKLEDALAHTIKIETKGI